MPLYRRIRDLREDKDLTQTQMGIILACSQRVYSNYERGDIDIPPPPSSNWPTTTASRWTICWSARTSGKASLVAFFAKTV